MSQPLPTMPIDILSEVFAASLHTSADFKDTSAAMKALLNVSSVSQLWRHAALVDASLWARIFDPMHPNLEWFNLVLARTHQHPLMIDATLDAIRDRFNTPMWVATFKEMHRIREIKLQLNGIPRGIHFLLDALCQPAPILGSLSIRHRPMEPLPHYAHETWGPSWILPIVPWLGHRHFGGVAPKLKTLRLVNAVIIPVKDDAAFRSLVSLEIRSEPRANLSPQWISPWFALQSRGLLSSLERMSVFGLYDPANSIPRSPSVIPVSPKLKRLSLSGSMEPCLRILDSIDIPSSCAVAVGVSALRILENGNESARSAALITSISRLWRREASHYGLCSGVLLKLTTGSLRLFYQPASSLPVDVVLFVPNADPGPLFREVLLELSRQNSLPSFLPKACITLDIEWTSPTASAGLHRALLTLLSQLDDLRHLYIRKYRLGDATSMDDHEKYPLRLVWRETEDSAPRVMMPSLKTLLFGLEMRSDSAFLRALQTFIFNRNNGGVYVGQPIMTFQSQPHQTNPGLGRASTD